MRKYLPESTLKAIAEDISEHITIRSYDNGCSRDDRRPTTTAEKDTLFRVAFGSLLALNWGEATRGSAQSTQAIIDAAEFIYLQVTADYQKHYGIEINSYDTIYLPLKRAIKNWEEQ